MQPIVKEQYLIENREVLILKCITNINYIYGDIKCVDNSITYINSTSLICYSQPKK